MKLRATVSILLIVSSIGIALTRQQERSWNRRSKDAGDYQIVFEVSGRVEVARFLTPPPDPLDLRAICSAKREAERRAFVSSEGYLSSLKEASDTSKYGIQMVQLHNELGQLHGYRGEMEKAIEQFETAYQLLVSNLPRHPEFADDKAYMEEILGVAWMRRGELENCVHNDNAETCIFPLSKAAQHRHSAGSEKAIEYFKKHLARKADNLEVRWLLNLAYMTLGKYPQAVPRQYLIPPSAFASKDKIGKFIDVAASLGIDPVGGAGGAIMDDFDNDGFVDIVISSVSACDPLRLFHNDGNGKFTDWTEKAKLSDQLGGINCTQTDYNNDGWLDIFVMRGGWEFPMRNSLLKNNGDGTFTDVTQAAGLASTEHRTHTAAWADFDNDGSLDVFIGHEETPSQLFRNRGDGTFEDVGRNAGVDRTAFTKGAAWGDYDNDGYSDLYVSNYGEENFFYRNKRDGTFAEIAGELRVEKPVMSFPTWFFDYDNNGWLDLFVASFVPSVTEVARGFLGMSPQAETMKLYRNTGQKGFQDVTKEMGLNQVVPTMGANFGDLDNDGFLDFYLGTGAPSYAALMPNYMFRNRGGKHFIDVTAATGTGHLQKGHGVAFGDINNDGSEDIYVNLGGFVPGDSYNKALFANPGNTGQTGQTGQPKQKGHLRQTRQKEPDNNWISIKLEGTKTNRQGIGAKIRLTLIGPAGERSLRYREVSAGGSFGASSLIQEIGLGRAKQIEALDIWWPVSDTRQTFKTVAANQFIEIKELAPDYQRRPLRSYPLFIKPARPQEKKSHHNY
jgi:FG-GAP-like repeat/ASPIC and UnbV